MNQINIKDWDNDIRSCCIYINENNLFNKKIYVRFPLCVKFNWINDNHALRTELIFDSMSWEIFMVSELEQNKICGPN